MVQKSRDISIRDAREGEQEAIQALTLAAYEEYAQIMSPSFWKEYSRVISRTLAEDGAAECIVAERLGKIVGSVLLYPPSANAYGAGAEVGVAGPEVRLLAVDPAMRGHGIGGMLMRECIQRARHDNFTALGLHTMDVMQSAMQLYERMGFVHVPELDFRPAEGIIVKGYSLNISNTD